MRRQLPHDGLRRFLIVPEARLNALLFEFLYLFAAMIEVKDTSRSWIPAIVIRPVVLQFRVPSFSLRKRHSSYVFSARPSIPKHPPIKNIKQSSRPDVLGSYTYANETPISARTGGRIFGCGYRPVE